jgi:hypothetical protein
MFCIVLVNGGVVFFCLWLGSLAGHGLLGSSSGGVSGGTGLPHDAEVNDLTLVVRLGEFFTIGGLVLTFALSVWAVSLAFSEGVLHGLMVLFVPFYYVYYVATRWDAMMTPFLATLGSAALTCFGFGMWSAALPFY